MSDAATLPMPAPPVIGESTRLGATMVLSVLLHAMVILGIGFAVEDAAPVMPTPTMSEELNQPRCWSCPSK